MLFSRVFSVLSFPFFPFNLYFILCLHPGVKKEKKSHQKTQAAYQKQGEGSKRRFNKLQVIAYKPLLTIYGCLDLCHAEQIGKRIRIAAGCLMSPTQFFTPYFSNKKAVKYQPQPQQSLPSGCFFLQPSLKWFLAVYTSLLFSFFLPLSLYRCGTNFLTTLGWNKGLYWALQINCLTSGFNFKCL